MLRSVVAVAQAALRGLLLAMAIPSASSASRASILPPMDQLTTLLDQMPITTAG